MGVREWVWRHRVLLIVLVAVIVFFVLAAILGTFVLRNPGCPEITYEKHDSSARTRGTVASTGAWTSASPLQVGVASATSCTVEPRINFQQNVSPNGTQVKIIHSGGEKVNASALQIEVNGEYRGNWSALDPILEPTSDSDAQSGSTSVSGPEVTAGHRIVLSGVGPGSRVTIYYEFPEGWSLIAELIVASPSDESPS